MSDGDPNAETRPIDPDRPATTDASDSAEPPTDDASVGADGSGVTIPSWLAGALVVVLALVIAGAGFAIGRATAPDDDGPRPIVATQPRLGGDGPRAFPGPGRMPGLPDPGERGRPHDERGRPHERGERPDRGGPDDDPAESSEEPEPPALPGT